jgi:cytochrome c nitrite reductase small subunit
MPRRTWPWLALAVPLGASLGVGVFTLGYAEALAYLSDDPEACANCHVMNEQLEGWLRGPHRAVAVCNDCHVPHDLLGKYSTKALNGWNHSKAFTLQDFHEPIRITPRNAAILQEGCLHCHGAVVHELISRSGDDPVRCVHCHRGVGHGPTR